MHKCLFISYRLAGILSSVQPHHYGKHRIVWWNFIESYASFDRLYLTTRATNESKITDDLPEWDHFRGINQNAQAVNDIRITIWLWRHVYPRIEGIPCQLCRWIMMTTTTMTTTKSYKSVFGVFFPVHRKHGRSLAKPRYRKSVTLQFPTVTAANTRIRLPSY